MRRRQMRHVLFTDPVEIRAGEEVDIYYNPNNTLLAGSGQVFLRGGWNRWRHPRGFGPVEMVPPAVGDHFRVGWRHYNMCYILHIGRERGVIYS